MPAVGEMPQPAGRGVPVHPGAAAVEQEARACAWRRPVDGPAGRWGQRDQDDLGALAAHPQYPVTVFLAKVADVCGGGLEDPQAEQAEHGHQREVARVRRLAGGGQQGLELQVSEPERG